MNKGLRKRILFTLAVLTVGCLLAAVFSVKKVGVAKDSLDEERYMRMVAEEKLEKAKGRLRVMDARLEKANEEVEQLNGLLKRKKGAISNLKIELDNTLNVNEILKQQLKEVLGQNQ